MLRQRPTDSVPEPHYNRSFESEAFGTPRGMTTVFDVGAGLAPRGGGSTTHGNSLFCVFRNRGDEPAGKSVTAKLLGDPAPDRFVPEIHDEVDHRRQPSPIHLTFAEMRRSYGETK